ncbi:MAG: hypothetical protein PHD91_07205 [bacterium]|nr:hypothetical protein [bacterium]MDD3806023.1 hypothetical protein [bacterium]MDD4153486.1 hypothetical protein [bacterium]MDD4558112.1 hypothetical protein [bacterium]
MHIARKSIGSDWEFAFTEHDSISSPDDCNRLTFHPAVVPETNLTDLQAAGLVKRETSATYEDSFAPYKYNDLVYRTISQGGEATDRKHVFLCFDGLDTVGDIFLNGWKTASVENAHTGYRFDVAGELNSGANELCLIFQSLCLSPLIRVAVSQLPASELGANRVYMYLRAMHYKQ